MILASGEQTRWSGVDAKQLIRIDGEPLILRTIRQVTLRLGVRPVVVTHHPCIQRTVGATADVLILPHDQRRWTAETTLHSMPVWGDATWILLGDVFWTDRAMDRICRMHCDEDIRYFITHGQKWDEILGVWLRDTHWDRWQRALEHAIRHARRGGRGKLWESYRSLCGFRLKKHKLDDYHRYPITDESTDFDALEDYLAFNQLRWSAAA